jgi:hypothetical protein
MDIKLLISSATLAAIMTGTPAIVSAQGACLAYEPLRRAMQERGVRLEGSGKIDIGNGTSTAIEVWVSPSGDFAFIAVDGDGIACIILSGAGWTKPERV